MELSELLGRKVDLRTPQDLSRYFMEEVCHSAEVHYAEKNDSIRLRRMLSLAIPFL